MKLGYGTWGIGGKDYGPLSQNNAINLLNYSILKGINFFDTAPLYGDGNSEKYLGKVIQKYGREKIIISTKRGMLPHEGFDLKQNFNLENLFNDLYASLKRLNTQYIDYYLLHSPDIEKINLVKIFNFFKILRNEKIIKNFGISLRSPKDILLVNNIDLDVVEFNFNLFDQRGIDVNIFQILKKRNIKSICRTPLCFGFLTDNKITKKQLHESDHRKKFWTQQQFNRWIKAKELFKDFYDKKIYANYSQFALNFCLSHPFDFVIPGMMSKHDIDVNLHSKSYKKINKEQLNLIYKIYKKNEEIIYKKMKSKKKFEEK